ncbi:MAG: amidohydrolase family protein [Oscillospiraceae bacterium]
MSKLMLKNALVNGAIQDILLEDGIISKMGPELAADTATVLLAQEGNLVIPGFVDCHAHIDKSHLNDKGENKYVHGTGGEKGALTRIAKAKFTVEDISLRAERVIRDAIKAGTLILRTNCDVDAIVGLKGIEALLGLKEKYREQITLQIAAFAQEGIFQDGKTPELLEEALRMGADLLGGHTITCGEGEKHIDFILELADKYACDADFHLDESGNREHYLLPYLAGKLKEMNMEGRVNAIHMCTLSALSEDELKKAIELILESRLRVTIAPTAISTRKIAPVKALLKAGVPLGLGSDNIRDFFNPLGSGDVKQMALLLSYLQAFYSEEENAAIWSMITDGGAKLLGANYEICPGASANLTAFSAKTPQEIISMQLQPSTIIRSGRILNI